MWGSCSKPLPKCRRRICFSSTDQWDGIRFGIGQLGHFQTAHVSIDTRCQSLRWRYDWHRGQSQVRRGSIQPINWYCTIPPTSRSSYPNLTTPTASTFSSTPWDCESAISNRRANASTTSPNNESRRSRIAVLHRTIAKMSPRRQDVRRQESSAVVLAETNVTRRGGRDDWCRCGSNFQFSRDTLAKLHERKFFLQTWNFRSTGFFNHWLLLLLFTSKN